MVDGFWWTRSLSSHHRQMVDGFVGPLGSGVFAVANVLPIGDFRRLSLVGAMASKEMRPAHTPYKKLLGDHQIVYVR
jgi:hypothetical protein